MDAQPAVAAEPQLQQVVAEEQQQQQHEQEHELDEGLSQATGHEGEEEQASTSGYHVPGYLEATAVMPKQPLEEYTHAGQDAIAIAFSPISMQGIRSLPDALANDFRHRLFEHLVAAHRAARDARRTAAATRELEGGASPKRGDARQRYQRPAPQQAQQAGGGTAGRPGGPGMTGHKQVARVHPYAGAFSNIEYMPSEYERLRVLGKFERLRNKLAQVNPTDFVVKGPPAGPKGAPSFSVFEASQDPFLPRSEVACAEERANREAILAGPFVSGGRVDKLAMLRGKADDCMYGLCKLLSADWPTAFLQVFEDVSGGIVVSFDAVRGVAEGDLSAYMQNLARNHALVSEYHLSKDGTQWGVVDEETQSVFYLLWPPWVRHRYKAAGASAS